MAKYAIQGGSVWTITHGKIENGVVLVEDTKIVQVGDAGTKIPADYTVIDATGKIVLPGFIDAHTHLSLFGDPSVWAAGDGNEKSGAIQARLRGIDSLNPQDPAIPVVREGGFTAVYTGPGSSNLIGGTGFVMKLRGRSVEEMVIPGTEGMKMALGENPKRNYEGKSNGTRMGNAAVLRDALMKATDYMRKVETAKAEGKPAPDHDLNSEALIPVLKRQMKARIHAHRADDILTAIRIAEEFNLDYIIEHCTEGYKIADILAAKHVRATVGPLNMGHSKQELWEVSWTNPAVLAEAGVMVALQNDTAANTRYLPIMAGIAVREGMKYDDALRGMTIIPAEMLGVGERMGSLEVGKDADIVIFTGDPLSNLSKCCFTMIDGEIYHQI
ncbi:MAG: amidohydrolase [Negativicutes bacterium]|nr:amidohydrolase [Negativicutes bacterium]